MYIYAYILYIPVLSLIYPLYPLYPLITLYTTLIFSSIYGMALSHLFAGPGMYPF